MDINKEISEIKQIRGRGLKSEPASPLDFLDELGNKFIAKARAKMARVKLHVAFEYYVEKHFQVQGCLL